MHQEFDDDLCHINKNFSRGDIVELDAGMPELEQIVGFGIVLAAGRADGLSRVLTTLGPRLKAICFPEADTAL